MSTFEHLVDEAYQIFLLQGRADMVVWLEKALREDWAVDAVKDFILRSLEKANEIVSADANMEEDETMAAYDDYVSKKSKEKKDIH